MPTSFIDLYLKTVEGTKSPKEYHIWCMLSAMSVLAGRRFWFAFGPFYYYPHLYTVLVGDPGVAKSSAMDRAKDLIRHVGCAPVAATQTTKEAITQEMSSEKYAGKKSFMHNGIKREYTQLAIFATELTQFIGVNPLGMVDFLTTIWSEAVYEVKTKHQGNDYITGPYITMCACMTPEIVKGYIKQNVLLGGFARRVAWVFSNTSNIVPFPTWTQEQQAALVQCIEFGKALQNKSGQFDWTPECKEYYDVWFRHNEETKRDRPPSTRGWYESKAEMLFKLSMLIALANEGGESPLVFGLPHYKLAMHYCSLVEANLPRVFEGAGINPSAQAINQVVHMLESMPVPMNEKVIQAMFFDSFPDLNALKDSIDHMVLVGRLKRLPVTYGGVAGGTVIGSLIGSPMAIDKTTPEEAVKHLARRDDPPPAPIELDRPSEPDPQTLI